MAEPHAFDGTCAVSGAHAFDTDKLAAWLAHALPGFKGPLGVAMFTGGQSNPTYQLTTPGRTYVMRAKPGPVAKLLPSAHAIEREYRVMAALRHTAVPVADMHVLCEDESVIGRAFYVMACVPGKVYWDQSLPGMTPSQRRGIYLEMNRVLTELHKVDHVAVGLGDYGKPGNYFERQIGRWGKQYLSSATQTIPEMDALIEWLPAHIPASALTDTTASIVHGDYRMDNLMFDPAQPRAMAVLDWELSTIGHPLADFSYHCMAWHIEPGAFRGIAGLDLAALGIPSEDEYIRLYCERTGFIEPKALAADWHFYLAYNMFRLAAILQGIAKRVQTGTAASAQALQSAAGAVPIARQAWQLAQQASR